MSVAAFAASRLRDMLKAHARVAVVGAPKTGKTTLTAQVTDRPVIHADDLIPLGWSEASAELAQKCNAIAGPMCVEGVSVPRALRKGLRVDAVLLLSQPFTPHTPGQAAMAKGVRTVWDEWHAANPGVVVFRA